jgi:uncharacterized membrane protein
MTEATVPRRPRWYRPASIWRSVLLRPRIYLAVLAGIVTLMILPKSISVSMQGALAWIVGGLTYLAIAGRSMINCDSQVIAARAGRLDDSRMIILAIVLLAIASSFVSIAGLINEAKEAAKHVKLWYLGLASATIVVSWCVTQVVFTLHYAHEFYRPKKRATEDAVTGELHRGLDFPGEISPDYWDFLYFATSIGATSQTSDVAIRSRAFRRLVTVHAVVSFFFNATVLALTINLAAGLI